MVWTTLGQAPGGLPGVVVVSDVVGRSTLVPETVL